MTSHPPTLSRNDWYILILLTLCWGINWPIMKIGVREFPPISFRALSMIGGLPALWLIARAQGASLAIPRGDLATVVRLALPNVLIWNLCIILGLSKLSSGRTAILGYTMPVWAVLCGLVFFGDRVKPAAWAGIGLAMTGAMLLLSSELANLAGQPMGTLLCLTAAATWGYGTVLLKRTRIEMPTISLTFWMLLVTLPVMAVVSFIFERQFWRMPNSAEWGAILYNAVIIFAFAHVVWFRLARLLPPVASSLSVMMIPVLGVFSGAWMLGETPYWQDYAAMLLILAAMSTVLLKPAK